MRKRLRDGKSLGIDVAVTVLIAGLGIALAISGQAIQSTRRNAEGSAPPDTFEPLMGFAASVIGLVILAWWCTALLIAVSGLLLHRCGHASLGTRISGYSPKFMRRLVLVVLSLNLVSAPVATASSLQSPIATSSAGTLLPQTGSGVELPSESRSNGTNPVWTPTERTAPISPRWKPRKTEAAIGPLIGNPRQDRSTSAQGMTVTVMPGDTLWSISAEHLGPYATDVEIAAEWPRWYAANRQVIGADPNLVLPGHVLTAPRNT